MPGTDQIPGKEEQAAAGVKEEDKEDTGSCLTHFVP